MAKAKYISCNLGLHLKQTQAVVQLALERFINCYVQENSLNMRKILTAKSYLAWSTPVIIKLAAVCIDWPESEKKELKALHDIAQNKTINGFENEHIDLVREFSSKFSYEAGRLIGDTVNNFYKGLWESSELPDFAKAIIKAFKKSS